MNTLSKTLSLFSVDFSPSELSNGKIDEDQFVTGGLEQLFQDGCHLRDRAFYSTLGLGFRAKSGAIQDMYEGP